MSEQNFQSVVLALYYRVDDIERRWASINERTARLAGIGAHHVVLYSSISEPGQVLVTMGIRHRSSVKAVLRSPTLFEWFDMDGVDDIPAVFAGEVLTRLDLTDSDDYRGAVIVGAISTISDVDQLVAKVHRARDRFAGAGLRKLRMYRAFDDEQEVMTLLEFDSLPSAEQWLDHLDADAEWMSRSRSLAHPHLFAGQLVNVTTLEAAP
ncbi:MAG TPA: fatty-acid--CoA ligase [Mycobacterium sp.]